ncbi:MAG: formate acetyltransferase [Spirochaetes bacterium]|nr:formate acetyltransferase [Spirochaetota bacterium]
MPARAAALREEVQGAVQSVCTERAIIWTQYHRRRENRKKPAVVRMAEALAEVLARKSIAIYPGELIVGNFSSKRVGGSIFPELHGVPVMLDLLRFRNRETNPLAVTGKEIRSLLAVIPFWMFRFMALRAYRSPLARIRFVADQLKAHFYLINESGGISHIAPDYEKLIRIGAGGFIAEIEERERDSAPDEVARDLYRAMKIIAEGIARFGERYGELAAAMAGEEADPAKRRELEAIAESCRRVPRGGAETFRDAVQSLFFAQIALNLESLDNSVCPGRMDQYLYPYYRRDLERGLITRDEAKELLACFSIKMSEIIPVFSSHLTNFHGGMFNGQVVTVGGVDRNGSDGVNELTYIFLELMDQLRMRQPNYHARVHAASPRQYMDIITGMLARGSNTPALYCDESIIAMMTKNGYSLEDARDYTGVGCVEPVSQGKSFSSTDAAIFNVPLCLEMALNGGRRFGHLFRSGARTGPAGSLMTMDSVKGAFEAQLRRKMGDLIRDLRAVELANRRYHPTPLTSMLIDGCIDAGRCSTAGGARYNFSGVQCVAPADTGDALFAVERAVFQEGRYTMKGLVAHLKRNLRDQRVRLYLRNLEKFGNDREETDRWTLYVIDRFGETLRSFGKNTRGGGYVTGLYSVTAHEYFGRITGALPSGRRRGEPFASGIAPESGMDRFGPTAVCNSVNRIDFTKIGNGVNLNAKFDPHSLRGDEGRAALQGLIQTYFRRGGMQMQINVLDPEMLAAARDDPALYPNLMVRVSGYSSYFNDLTPAMKDEIIRRSLYQC